MEQQFTQEVLQKLKRKRRRRGWRRALSVMMCVVVFWTTYALILPAITMETDTFCGMEKHLHEEKCYEETLLCPVHVHGEQCFALQQNLICTLSTEPEHTHTEDCVPQTLTEQTCTLQELPGHSHTEACGISTVQELTCNLKESTGHAHGEGCYTAVTTYGCGLEESIGHAHGEGCYTTVTTYSCGLEEIPAHIHEDGCYETASVQICTLEEDPAHTHEAACYGSKLTCGLEEHEHETMCYSDPAADVETPEQWQATLPKRSGIYAEDVVAIAQSQLGYTESQLNYIVAEDGTLRGYTRYGAWCDQPYGDWGTMFVSFCLHYAGAPEMPNNADCSVWVSALRAKELFYLSSERVPKAGDLIFFDQEQDGRVDGVGLVEKQEDITVTVIEGDSNNQVERNTYDLFDKRIVGYGVPGIVEAPTTENTTEDTEWLVGPDDADAWAVLVDPDGNAVEAQKATATAAAGTYSLRRMAASTFAARGTPLDLTPYINSVTMYDADGNPLPSGTTVAEGDQIQFKIEYTVTGQQLGVMNGENVTVKTDTLVYQLPEYFALIKSASGNIINTAGVKVGTYVIDNDSGTISLTFTDDFAKQNAQGIQIHGYVSFYAKIAKLEDGNQEEQKYQFTDGIVLGVVIEEKNTAKGDVMIEKLITDVDGEYLTYRVKVTSIEGTTGEITVKDQMSEGLTFVKGISVQDANGNNVSGARFVPSADRSSYTMTLPEMAPNSSYIITYRCKANMDLLDADMTVSNTASVAGKDDQGGKLEDDVTVNHTFDVLKKTGKDNKDGTITWTITINEAKVDISGWELQDILRISNVERPYKGPVTIRDSRGNVVAANVTLPYTFPNGSKDTYVITYTTEHGYSDGVLIFNKAILTKDDQPKGEVESNVGIGITPFEKSGVAGELTQDANGTNLVPITWTVTIDTANGEIPAGEVIYDKMNGSYHQADMYMTYDQLMAAIDAVTEALESVGSSVLYVSAETFVVGDRTGDYYNGTALQSNEACKTYLYERFSIKLGKAIPEGKRLSFSYVAYGIFRNNIVEETTYQNRISLENKYEIEANTKFTSGKIKATKFGLNYYDPDSTENQDWHLTGGEATSEYDYEDLHDSYLAWAIELSVPPGYLGTDDMVIHEDLPEGVAVKGLDMSFLSQVPTSRLKMRDMAPGNTYTWDFMVYPADQYGAYGGPQGGEMVSITVVVTKDGDLEITVPAIVFSTMAERIDIDNQWRPNNPLPEWWSYLYIYTQIDEDFDWTPKSEGAKIYLDRFENKYTLKDEDGNLIDYGSQTQVIKKDERTGAIRKEGAIDENDIITYKVLLNAYERDLIENSATLRVHDELTYQSTTAQPLRLRLVPGSVKLYEVDVKSNGTYTVLGELTANYTYAENSTKQGDVTTWVQTIDLVVPDDKGLLLEYSYRATGNKTAVHQVANDCSISGVGEGNLNGDYNVSIDLVGSAAQADTQGVMIYKVDASNNGIYLKDAKFHIYIWHWDEKTQKGQYINVHHPDNGSNDFVTDANGMILLDSSTVGKEQFAYNTAYYIVEVESPENYYLSSEPYYFYIAHEDTKNYPPNIPQGFTGQALVSGDIIYRNNVNRFTEISIEKYWQDRDGDSVTVLGTQVPSITVELWQKVEGVPGSDKLYGTYTMTPDEKGNWNLTVTQLPKSAVKADGTRGTDYLYYVKEVNAGLYALESSTNNGGINAGVIKLVNREQDGYILPETGGAGTHLHTVAGLLLMLASAAYLMYIVKNRRREDAYSS